MSHHSCRLQTIERTALVEITEEVRTVLTESGIGEGMCTVYVPHTTAGVTINEAADPSVRRDMVVQLNKVVPFDDGYTHLEGNSAAHIKASLMGSSVTIPVSGGRLALGTWQGVYFCEFDGPRNRTFSVSLIAG